MHRIPYPNRVPEFFHPLGKHFLQLMSDKKSNLAVAVDALHCEELLEFADLLGPEICLLKTHIDIVEDFTPELTKELSQLARRHGFLILEDRKFADIGKIVGQQYGMGIYKIAEWADLITVHGIPGPGILEGLKQIGLPKERGCLLLAEMSSAQNLISEDYSKKVVDMAKQHADFTVGFIAQHRLLLNPDFIYFTPGINLERNSDLLGQRYVDPELAIRERGTDVIIVGRGITESSNPLHAAQHYRFTGWSAYQKAIK